MDFTLTRPINLEDILAGLIEIFAAVEAACGFRIAIDREDRHSPKIATHFIFALF